VSVVRDRVTDGVRIAELLASEVHGRTDGELAHVAVVDAVGDVEPTADGARAYDISFARSRLVDAPDRDVEALSVLDDDGDGAGSTDGDDVESPDAAQALASVFVQPDRVRLEFQERVDAAATAAEDTRLRVRPKATTPPRTLVFVESGAAVKDAADVVAAAVSAALDHEGTDAEADESPDE
jgi:hypothetical protein